MLITSFQTKLLEAGCDEAGRGCLAGDLFAAAVILPAGFEHPHLNDSKKMTERRREELRVIIEQEAIAWAVQRISPERIDQINILNSSFEAMSLAAERLCPQPELLSIDGNRFKTHLSIPYNCIVKGDGKYANIAAASVLAKSYRDHYMELLDEEYPLYNWRKNKGYPTRDHRLAILKYGLTPYHRLTFNHGADQLSLFDL